MLDYANERLITPSEAAKQLPSGRPGKRVHVATIHRWIAQGILDSIRIGGRRFTSIEAIERFIRRNSFDPRVDAIPLTTQTTGRVPAKAKAAMDELTRRGI